MADLVPKLGSRTAQPGSYDPQFLNPNAYNKFSVTHDPLKAPGFFQQFLAGLGNGIMSPIGNMITGGIGSIIGTGLNMFTQNWQNQNAIDMWNMENEYNTPANQIQRFLDAGINPAEAVQAVTGGPNTAGSLSPANNPSQSPDLMSMMGNSANNSLNQRLVDAQIQTQQANTENIKADTDLKKSQDVGQKIENMNRQSIIDSTLRKMQDEHEIDSQTVHALMRDNVMQDMLFTGKIQQFWIQTATMAQELVNLEEEHNRIISEINKNYSEMSLNAQLAVESDARTQKTLKEKEIAEENRRYLAYRRNMISQYHWDPESSVQQNIGFAMAVGDVETADYWMRHLGRVQAEIDGWSEEQKGYMNQQFRGYQGLLDLAKYMAGGYAIGAAGKSGKMSVDARGNVTPPAGYRVGKVKNYGNVSNYYTDPMSTYDVFNPGPVKY